MSRPGARNIDIGATKTTARVIRRLYCISVSGAKAYPFTRQQAPPGATRHFVRHRSCVASTRAINSASFSDSTDVGRLCSIRKRALGGLILMMVSLSARALGNGTRVLARFTVGGRHLLICPYL